MERGETIKLDYWEAVPGLPGSSFAALNNLPFFWDSLYPYVKRFRIKSSQFFFSSFNCLLSIKTLNCYFKSSPIYERVLVIWTRTWHSFKELFLYKNKLDTSQHSFTHLSLMLESLSLGHTGSQLKICYPAFLPVASSGLETKF